MKSLTCLIAILGLLVAATHAQNDEEPTRKRTLDHMISRVMKRGNSGFSRMISRVMRRSDPDFYNAYEDQLDDVEKRALNGMIARVMKRGYQNMIARVMKRQLDDQEADY